MSAPRKPEILNHDSGYFDGEQYVFDAEEIKEAIDWVDALEAKSDEAMRLLNEAQYYVSHANYDLYLAIQIDEFLASLKVIES